MWPLRRARYVAGLAESDAFVMIAGSRGRDRLRAWTTRGRTDARVTGPGSTYSSRWPSRRIAAARGSARAERAVFAELRRLGATELEIGIVFDNEDARRSCEREGPRP